MLRVKGALELLENGHGLIVFATDNYCIRANSTFIPKAFIKEYGLQRGHELEVLALMVDAWEDTHHPIDDPDPIEFLKNVMEFQGYGQKDLAELLNSRPRASEILNRQRPLSLSMVRKISLAWQVPAEPLIREYSLARSFQD